MKQIKSKGNLYVLARQAKNRMRNFSRNKSLTEHFSYSSVNYSTEDELLYKKICKILEEDRIIINPIKELIDKKHYDSLSLEGKQRYIFDMSDKYKELKERYYREHAMISVSNY